MILVKFVIEPKLERNTYGLQFVSCSYNIGESHHIKCAVNAVQSILSSMAFVTNNPEKLCYTGELGFFVDYHEGAKLTSKISPSLPQDYYLSQIDLSKKIEQKERFPILHMSAADMLSGDRRIVHNIRYYKIMDSSIWNYYYSFQDLYCDENKDHLKHIIEEIVNNQLMKLYDLNIATEYADLNSRIVLNNYTEPTGHGSDVSPFLFHSEWKMKQEYDYILNNSTIAKYKWRFLLLDDCAMDSLRTLTGEREVFDASKRRLVASSKLFILKNAIERIKEFHVSWRYLDYKNNVWIDSSFINNSNSNVDIWCVTSIKEAISLLHEYKFDVIFLDYLLGNKSLTKQDFCQKGGEMDNECKEEYNQYVHSSIREYGYHLLKRLKKLQKDCPTNFRAPLGRQYFIFISAFTTAVDERLRAEGLNRSEKFWYIAEGACPTNTPQLFLFNLLKLMDKRLGDSGILKLSSSEIYTLIDKIYLPKEQDVRGDSVRKRANALYQKVLSLQYHYRNILKDVDIPLGQNSNDFDTRGSVLMTNFIQNKINLGGMLEHLTQLVHLTAFGTIRQWPEMWEEYIYFKAQFEKQSKDGGKDSDSVDPDKLKGMFTNIEKYILELKSQQQ